MSGDYSRTGTDPHRAWSSVWMQQGRVALDADWNEQASIIERRTRAQTVDVVGRCGVPVETPEGFRITISMQSGSKALWIGRGRYYVDGLLAENFGPEPYAFDLGVARADGRGSQGVLGELLGGTAISYATQPFWPVPDTLPAGNGPHLVYLDVWHREVTAVEEPALLEKALDGVDTTTRLQTVWQVRVLPDIGPSVGCTTPPAAIPGWRARTDASAGRLTTQLSKDPAPTDPCLIAAMGGYRGLENQLYRVEVHDGGPLGTATFKWSRDNGTVVANVEAIIAPDIVTLTTTGRDALLQFNPGDWVEVTDDRMELAQTPGVMRQVKTVNHDNRRVTLIAPLPASLIPSGVGADTLARRHVRMRRWDQARLVRDANANLLVDLDAPGSAGVIRIPAAGIAVVLETGIQALFNLGSAGGSFRSGDWWTFAARSIDASIELLDHAPPQGVRHHYAPLAIIRWPDEVLDDRMPLVPLAGRINVCSALHLDSAQRVSPLLPGEEVPLSALRSGIELMLRQTVDPNSVNDGSLYLTADAPFTAPGPYGASTVVGYTPVVLPGAAAVIGDGLLRWRGQSETLDYLSGLLTGGALRIGSAKFETWLDAFNNDRVAGWRVGPGNVVRQDGSGAAVAGRNPVLPLTAIHRYRLSDNVNLIWLNISQPANRLCGLAFNWTSPNDFAMFYLRHFWQPVGFSGAISTVRTGLGVVKNGVIVSTQERDVLAGFTPTACTLNIRRAPLPQGVGFRTVFACSVQVTGGPTVINSGLDLQDEPLVTGSRLGLLDQPTTAGSTSPGTAVFTQLAAVYGDRPRAVLIPLGAAPRVLARLTLKRSLLALSSGSQGAFAPPVPEPDYETWFWVTPDVPSYGYGYSYAGLYQGIGAGLLLNG